MHMTQSLMLKDTWSLCIWSQPSSHKKLNPRLHDETSVGWGNGREKERERVPARASHGCVPLPVGWIISEELRHVSTLETAYQSLIKVEQRRIRQMYREVNTSHVCALLWKRWRLVMEFCFPAWPLIPVLVLPPPECLAVVCATRLTNPFLRLLSSLEYFSALVVLH